MMKNPGRVFSADEIYERIWNEKAVNTDTIMVHVRNIREKIEINPKDPKYLKVVWGVGYKIDIILSTSSDFAESIITGKSYCCLSFITMVIPSILGIITSIIARLKTP